MPKIIHTGKLAPNVLYYGRITQGGSVSFIRPTTQEEFDNQPKYWPYKVTHFGGDPRTVEVEYKGFRLALPYLSPKEAVRLFHKGIREYADITLKVEKAFN